MAKRRTALPELLSPAGTMECFYAAVEAGADAVYVGGELFSARAFAGNFFARGAFARRRVRARIRREAVRGGQHPAF